MNFEWFIGYNLEVGLQSDHHSGITLLVKKHQLQPKDLYSHNNPFHNLIVSKLTKDLLNIV